MNDLPTVLVETKTLDDAIIVQGTKEKKRILDAYKECFGQDFNHSIVSKKKGKIKLDPTLDYPHNQLWTNGIRYQGYQY
jgi:hypothetical protein